MIVTSCEDVQVAGGGDGGGDGCSVLRDGVSDCGRVAGDTAGNDVITDFGTGEETIVAEDDITAKCGALEEVDEGAGVEEGLAIMEVEFGALGLGGGGEIGNDFGLQALGESVVELDLCVEGIEGCPGLGQGDT